MVYLDMFRFVDSERDADFRMDERRTCFASMYPFGVLSQRYFERIDFEPVTILYGGNGSGKSTALHIIAEKLSLAREAPFNKTAFFEDYVRLCKFKMQRELPKDSRIITSDDVFDHMLRLRELNEGIATSREEMFEDYWQAKRSGFKLTSMADFEELQRVNRARKRTMSRYVKETLEQDVRTFSNGESAFAYFTNKIGENALYLLDEPENSLSPKRQQELAQFIEDSARFMGCQFVISTHSPFVLALRGAKIYDLSSNPVDVRRWTELENVRAYYDFFKKHEGAFKEEQ